MFEMDRAKVVAENFTKHLQNGLFPQPRSETTLQDAGLTPQDYLDLFDSQMKSRHLDLMARQLKQDNLGFYTISEPACPNRRTVLICKKTGCFFTRVIYSAFFALR